MYRGISTSRGQKICTSVYVFMTVRGSVLNAQALGFLFEGVRYKTEMCWHCYIASSVDTAYYRLAVL